MVTIVIVLLQQPGPLSFFHALNWQILMAVSYLETVQPKMGSQSAFVEISSFLTALSKYLHELECICSSHAFSTRFELMRVIPWAIPNKFTYMLVLILADFSISHQSCDASLWSLMRGEKLFKWRRLRKNRWVGERNRKKPKTSKTSPFLWQTEKEWWMGSKGISKPWKILLTDFIARHDEKSEVWKGTGSAAAELNSFEASGEVTHCPKTLTGVISHAKGLRSEVCILMFVMEWMLWLFLSKQPFFSPRKNGHEIETSFPHQHLIQGAWLDLLWVLCVKS